MRTKLFSRLTRIFLWNHEGSPAGMDQGYVRRDVFGLGIRADGVMDPPPHGERYEAEAQSLHAAFADKLGDAFGRRPSPDFDAKRQIQGCEVFPVELCTPKSAFYC